MTSSVRRRGAGLRAISTSTQLQTRCSVPYAEAVVDLAFALDLSVAHLIREAINAFAASHPGIDHELTERLLTANSNLAVHRSTSRAVEG